MPPTAHTRPQPAHPSGQATALGPRAVLVPVKAFGDAKRRLDPAVSPAERAVLARQMAHRVLAAASPLPVAVVCDSLEVANWARSLGALIIWEPGRGLNGAVEAGVSRLASMGAREVTVAHADLPLATSLTTFPVFEGVTLVPDRHGDGTNVIRLPVGCGFRFSYGPGSFDRHRRQCAALGLPCLVLEDPRLGFDVDSPADLAGARLQAQREGGSRQLPPSSLGLSRSAGGRR